MCLGGSTLAFTFPGWQLSCDMGELTGGWDLPEDQIGEEKGVEWGVGGCAKKERKTKKIQVQDLCSKNICEQQLNPMVIVNTRAWEYQSWGRTTNVTTMNENTRVVNMNKLIIFNIKKRSQRTLDVYTKVLQDVLSHQDILEGCK